VKTSQHTYDNRFTALFRDHPNEPVSEEKFWTLWCKGGLTEADTPTIRLGMTPSGLTSAHLYHPPFLQAGCLFCAQPIVSKHWRQTTYLQRIYKKLRKILRLLVSQTPAHVQQPCIQFLTWTNQWNFMTFFVTIKSTFRDFLRWRIAALQISFIFTIHFHTHLCI